jgi:hypothetical protein
VIGGIRQHDDSGSTPWISPSSMRDPPDESAALSGGAFVRCGGDEYRLAFGNVDPCPENREVCGGAPYSPLSDAMSMEKRYLTSDFSMRS